MKEILVLGTGCAKCSKTAEVIQLLATELAIPVHVVKETSPEVIMRHGVMRTPAVVVDDTLVHSGSVPDRKTVERWLTQATTRA